MCTLRNMLKLLLDCLRRKKHNPNGGKQLPKNTTDNGNHDEDLIEQVISELEKNS